MDLPDANLWLALTDPNHSQHVAARHYWDELRADSIVFCRIVSFDADFARFPKVDFLHLRS